MYCDNEAVVEVLQKGYARIDHLMHSLRCGFITPFYEMIQKPVHIPGPTNTVADVISRNNMGVFQSQVLQVATMAPARIPPSMVNFLIQQCPDWSQLFKNSLQLE